MQLAREHRTLADWLQWQQQLHPAEMELGLDRLWPVAARMGLRKPASRVITVAGTNGKGSAVALLERILCAAGYRVGSYTSPHLLHYNERIRIDTRPVRDADLCTAFARVETARQGVTLTFFEYGTLAALDLLQRQRLDLAILEVGLGGRLDAVNLIDADAVLLMPVAIDHSEWLGPDRETIGAEKAGVFRSGIPVVYAEPRPPASVLRMGAELQVVACRRGYQFDALTHGSEWDFVGGRTELIRLPRPRLAGGFQVDNACAAVAVVQLPELGLNVDRAAIEKGLSAVVLAGRFQIVPGAVEWILDVAHNPAGATVLASALGERSCAGRTLAVTGMLRGKDSVEVYRLMKAVVDVWYPASLSPPRGSSGSLVAKALAEVRATEIRGPYEDIGTAISAAAADARRGDRIVVFGSFLTVAAGLRVLHIETDGQPVATPVWNR